MDIAEVSHDLKLLICNGFGIIREVGRTKFVSERRNINQSLEINHKILRNRIVMPPRATGKSGIVEVYYE